MGKIPILTNIFQMGWFNHQPVNDLISRKVYAYSVDALIIIAPETFQHQTGEKLGHSAIPRLPEIHSGRPFSPWLQGGPLPVINGVITCYNHEFVGL